MKRIAFSHPRGYSTLQLLITIAVMAIVAGFAVVNISRARDHVRLMNSARQFAAYAERARADAVRRHNGTNVAVVDNNTYTIRMDWDGFGNATDRNFDLERGIVFTSGMVGKSVSFNWRGRIAAEESFGFSNGRNSVTVGITGSGDVTFDAQYFYDSQLPPVSRTGIGGGVTPEPGASPLPPPPPNPTPTPTPSGTDPTPTPAPTPPGTDPTPTPTPTPPGTNPTPTPTPAPTPPETEPPPTQPCAIQVSPEELSIASDGSVTVTVNRTNILGTGTISGSSDNSGQIQVSPSSRTVSGTSPVTFTVTVKKIAGSVTFSAAGCTSKTVPITIR